MVLVAPVATRTPVVVVPVIVSVLVVSFHVKVGLPSNDPLLFHCTSVVSPPAPVPSPPLSAAQMRLPEASGCNLPVVTEDTTVEVREGEPTEGTRTCGCNVGTGNDISCD